VKIAVIPARGGSKRIPRKNIRPFLGKPIITYSIRAAHETGLFDHVLVSTDDEEIASVARAAGAETPFLRPADLSDDQTGTLPVIHHAAEWMASQGRAADHVCCIYATAPFVTADALHDGYERLQAAQADFALAVTPFPFPIQRALRITEAGLLQPVDMKAITMRSQDLEEAWHDAGQFFWAKPSCLSENIASLLSRAVPVPLPPHRVQDIDTPDDWQRAELMFRALSEN